MQLVDTCMGFSQVKLLHLNDSEKECATKIDKHAITGQGCIGKEALQRFMNYPQLAHASVLLELPVLDDQEEITILDTIRSWNKNS